MVCDCTFEHVKTGQVLHLLVPEDEAAVITQSSYVGESDELIEFCREVNKIAQYAHNIQRKYAPETMEMQSFGYDAAETVLFNCGYKLKVFEPAR